MDSLNANGPVSRRWKYDKTLPDRSAIAAVQAPAVTPRWRRCSCGARSPMSPATMGDRAGGSGGRRHRPVRQRRHDVAVTCRRAICKTGAISPAWRRRTRRCRSSSCHWMATSTLTPRRSICHRRSPASISVCNTRRTHRMGSALARSNNAFSGSITGAGTGTGNTCAVANTGCPSLSSGPGILDGARITNQMTFALRYQGTRSVARGFMPMRLTGSAVMRTMPGAHYVRHPGDNGGSRQQIHRPV